MLLTRAAYPGPDAVCMPLGKLNGKEFALRHPMHSSRQLTLTKFYTRDVGSSRSLDGEAVAPDFIRNDLKTRSLAGLIDTSKPTLGEY